MWTSIAGASMPGDGDAEGDAAADQAGVLGQAHLLARDPAVEPGAEAGPVGGRDLAGHPEQLAEADPVGPEGVELLALHAPDEQLVEARRGVRRDGDRPEHQLRVVGRVGGAGGVAAAVRVELALDLAVHPRDDGEDAVGLGAGAEEDGLEHLRRGDEPLEGLIAVARVVLGADVVARVEGADQQRALAVHETD